VLAIYNLLTVLLIMQEMYALRHKKHKSNTGSNHGATSGSNPQGVESNTNQSRRVGADGGNSDRSSPNGVQSSRNNATRVRADCGSSERSSLDGVQSNRNQSRRIAGDGGNFRRSSPAGVNSERSANAGDSQQNGSGDGAQLNGGSEGGNSQLNVNPSKRGRGKLTRTELKMVPRSGRVQLEPVGHWQVCMCSFLDITIVLIILQLFERKYKDD